MASAQHSSLSFDEAANLLPALMAIAKSHDSEGPELAKSINNFNILRILYQFQHGLHTNPFFKTINTNILSTSLYILPKYKWVAGDRYSSHCTFESISTKHPSISKRNVTVYKKAWELLSNQFSSSSISLYPTNKKSIASLSTSFDPFPDLKAIKTHTTGTTMLPAWPNISHANYPVSNSSKKRDRVPYIIQPCVDYYIIIDFECTCLPRKDQMDKITQQDDPSISQDMSILPSPSPSSSYPNKSVPLKSTFIKSLPKSEPKVKTKKKGQRGYQPPSNSSKSSKSSKNGSRSSNSVHQLLSASNLCNTSSESSNVSIVDSPVLHDTIDTENDSNKTTEETDTATQYNDPIEHPDVNVNALELEVSTPSKHQKNLPPHLSVDATLSPMPIFDDGTFQNEIIEFPAILVNARDLTIVSIFHTYVKPTLHPILSDFCIDLTHITQEQVNNAPTIDIAMLLFIQWTQSYGLVFHNSTFIFQTLLNALSIPLQSTLSTIQPSNISFKNQCQLAENQSPRVQNLETTLPPCQQITHHETVNNCDTNQSPILQNQSPNSFYTIHSILNSNFLPSLPNLSLDTPLDIIMSGDRKLGVNIDRKLSAINFNKLAEFSYFIQFPQLIYQYEALYTQPLAFFEHSPSSCDDYEDDHNPIGHLPSKKKNKLLLQRTLIQQTQHQLQNADKISSSSNSIDPEKSPQNDQKMNVTTFVAQNARTMLPLQTQIDIACHFLPQYLTYQSALASNLQTSPDSTLPSSLFSSLLSPPLQPVDQTTTTSFPSIPFPLSVATNAFTPPPPPLPQPSKFDRFEYFLQSLQAMDDLLSLHHTSIFPTTQSSPLTSTSTYNKLSHIFQHYDQSTTVINSQVIPHNPILPQQFSTTPTTPLALPLTPPLTSPPFPPFPQITPVGFHTGLLVSDGPTDFLNFLIPELRLKGHHWLLTYLFGITNTISTVSDVAPDLSSSPNPIESTQTTTETNETTRTFCENDENDGNNDAYQSKGPKLNSSISTSSISPPPSTKYFKTTKFNCKVTFPLPTYFNSLETEKKIHIESNLYFCNIRHVLYQISIASKFVHDLVTQHEPYSLSFPNNTIPLVVNLIKDPTNGQENQGGGENPIPPTSTLNVNATPNFNVNVNSNGSIRSTLHRPFLSTIFPSEHSLTNFNALIHRLIDPVILPHTTLAHLSSSSTSSPSTTLTPIPITTTSPSPSPPTSFPLQPTSIPLTHHLSLSPLPFPPKTETVITLPIITYKFQQHSMTPWKFYIGKYQGGGLPHFLSILNMRFIGHLHSGINDSINITRILFHVCFHSDYTIGFTGVGAI